MIQECFFTLADTTSIPMGAMYLHATMFCTLAHMSSIPMGAMYLYMHERILHLLIPLLFPWVKCIYKFNNFFTLADTILYPLRAPIFKVITEVWLVLI